MTPGEIDQLADTIVTKLRTDSMVPGQIPRYITDTILKWTGGRPFDFRFVAPAGPEGFIILIRVLANGTINLRLATMNHVIFWEADLKPA